MENQRKASNLIHTEDWLSVWIGVIIIAIGSVAVLTGWFDFSALSFKTWTVGEVLSDKDASKVVPLLQQISSWAFWRKTLVTILVLGTLFGAGVKLQGEKLRKFIPAFLALFVIAVVVRIVSAEFTLKRNRLADFQYSRCTEMVETGYPHRVLHQDRTCGFRFFSLVLQYCKVRPLWTWNCLGSHSTGDPVYVVVRQ